MRFVPELLEALVPSWVEGVRLQDAVEFSVSVLVEGDGRSSPEDALVAAEELRFREAPEERRQTIDVASLVKGFAYALHLLYG